MSKVREIGPLQVLFGRFPVFPYCNTLILRGRRTLLADPACEEKRLRALAAGEKINFLFNTHYHPDHIRYDSLFDGAEFLAHRRDAPCFRSLDAMAEWIGVKGTEYEAGWKTSMVERHGFRQRAEVTEVDSGTDLDLGGVTVQFRHLPGHTPGHSGFFIPELNAFFIADVELSPAGPWYHNQRASIEEIIQSVEQIRQTPADYYIPSHGQEIFTGDIGARLDRYLENIYAREEKILQALSSPHTLDELAAKSLISGFKLPRHQVWFLFERNMVQKHLHRLLAQEKILQIGDQYLKK